jgi:SagB-type dehydrogenase family enzyme
MTAVCAGRLEMRPGVSSAVRNGELWLFRQTPGRPNERFGAPDTMKRALLARLAEGGCTAAELATMEGSSESGGDMSAFVTALEAGGWLMTTVSFQGRDLYTVQPLRSRSGVPKASVAEPGGLVMSRFAIMRREGDRILVESPVARSQVLVHAAEVATLIAGLVLPKPGDPGEGAPADPLPAVVRDRIVRDLLEAGLVVPASAESGRDASLWRPHDLYFHAHSRLGAEGYFGAGYGRTLWGKQEHEPLPARPEPFPGPAVELYRPDLDALRTSDRPLAAVVEDRRSIRSFDDGAPITADQLGELLYRCARARAHNAQDGVEYLSRPYPSGGGLYELELYPVVRRVSGLSQGVYHYDTHEHRLRLVREPGPAAARLLQAAASAAAMAALPQVLIVVAARFGRVMWSYEQLPYALILKNLGALYQTMYLVATSMGLAPCGLGSGDTAAFEEATGLDFMVEGSVGEFALGSRHAE